jgi:hypothetical protein
LKPYRIGVDLDNTIICYDRVFGRVAMELGLLAAVPKGGKVGVKQAVTERHGPDAWTELQGEVYGPRLSFAEPFAGVQDFFQECRQQEISAVIISHKTTFPALGPQVNLREAALAWLEGNGWFDLAGIALTREAVEFHDTRAEKVSAIARQQCDWFIDDLPEVFAEPHFPVKVRRFLFDPFHEHDEVFGAARVQTWPEMQEYLMGVKRT